MRIPPLRNPAFSLVELLIVVAIIGLLAAIALPNFARARENSQRNSCINNLRQIDSAVKQYQLEHNLQPVTGSDIPAANLVTYIKNGANLSCPAGTATTLETAYKTGSGHSTEPPECVANKAKGHVLQ